MFGDEYFGKIEPVQTAWFFILILKLKEFFGGVKFCVGWFVCQQLIMALVQLEIVSINTYALYIISTSCFQASCSNGVRSENKINQLIWCFQGMC